LLAKSVWGLAPAMHFRWVRVRTLNVLKITITETPTERRWVVEGRLVGPWARELRTMWNKTHPSQGGRTCIIDLSGVTSIDSRGHAALIALIGEGAYNEYLVKELMNEKRQAGASRRKHHRAISMDSNSASESSQAGQRSPTKEKH
jgi:hypothetical protein